MTEPKYETTNPRYGLVAPNVLAYSVEVAKEGGSQSIVAEDCIQVRYGEKDPMSFRIIQDHLSTEFSTFRLVNNTWIPYDLRNGIRNESGDLIVMSEDDKGKGDTTIDFQGGEKVAVGQIQEGICKISNIDLINGVENGTFGSEVAKNERTAIRGLIVNRSQEEVFKGVAAQYLDSMLYLIHNDFDVNGPLIIRELVTQYVSATDVGIIYGSKINIELERGNTLAVLNLLEEMTSGTTKKDMRAGIIAFIMSVESRMFTSMKIDIATLKDIRVVSMGNYVNTIAKEARLQPGFNKKQESTADSAGTNSEESPEQTNGQNETRWLPERLVLAYDEICQLTGITPGHASPSEFKKAYKRWLMSTKPHPDQGAVDQPLIKRANAIYDEFKRLYDS